MKIQDVESKFPPFDKPSGEAQYLISTGKFVAYQAPKPSSVRTPVESQWHVKQGAQGGLYPPYIFAQCPNCGSNTTYEGDSPEQLQLRHCRPVRVDRCPTDVAEQYLRAKKAHGQQPLPERKQTSNPAMTLLYTPMAGER